MTNQPADDLSFLAPPEELADWRMVLAYEAVANAGVLDALPGTLPDLAVRCDLHDGALRAVLGQLVAWGAVTEDTPGHYAVGPAAPLPPQDAVLLRHAATIRRWAALLGPRLRDRAATLDGFPARPPAPVSGEPNLHHRTTPWCRPTSRLPLVRAALERQAWYGTPGRSEPERGVLSQFVGTTSV